METPRSPPDSSLTNADKLEEVGSMDRSAQQDLKQKVSQSHILLQARLLISCKLLRRDGHKCCVTGYFDSDSVLEDASVLEGVIEVSMAHIMPYSLSTFDSQRIPVSPLSSATTQFRAHPFNALQTARSALTWSILKAWAPRLNVDVLMGEGIDDESNALTLLTSAHRQFGAFNLWLQPTVSFLGYASGFCTEAIKL